jgi:O-antigen/teichoic acid export membrane protein
MKKERHRRKPQEEKPHATYVSVKRIVNNTAISLIGQLVTWVSTLLLLVAYGRFLGDVKFGELYLAITFVGLVGFPVEFSFSQQLTRDVAQDTSKAISYLSNALLIKVALWFVLYSLLLLLSWLLGYDLEQRILIAICGFTLLSSSIASTFGSLHIAYERVVFPVVGTILEKGLSALIGVLILRQGVGVEVMAGVLLGSSIANVIWQSSWFIRLVGVSFGIDWVLIRGLVRTSIPFVAYGILGVIYYRIDTVLLSLMTNAAVVGWYGAGYRLFDTLNFLPTILMTPILYPVFSKLSISSEERLKLAIEKTMNLLLFFGIPMALGLIFAAPNIVGFLYHRPEFVHTVPALQALAPGLVFLYINAVLGTIIVSTKREKKFPIMAAIALVFNLGLNLILIPVYQHVGAAIVTSLTELLLASIAIVFIPKHLLPMGSWRVGAKSLVASLVMAGAILLMSTFQILVILPVAMLVYFGTATLLRTIPREDVQQLYRAIRRNAHEDSTSSGLEPQDEASEITEKRHSQRVGDIQSIRRTIQQAEMWTSPSSVGYQEDEKEKLSRIQQSKTSPEVAQ